MISIAICSNFLVGYDRRGVRAGVTQLLVLPLILAVAFFMIADIDSPRWGSDKPTRRMHRGKCRKGEAFRRIGP